MRLRQITHTILDKELKHCRHLDDLEVNENVKGKAKDYVTKYMSKFGAVYKPTGSPWGYLARRKANRLVVKATGY